MGIVFAVHRMSLKDILLKLSPTEAKDLFEKHFPEKPPERKQYCRALIRDLKSIIIDIYLCGGLYEPQGWLKPVLFDLFYNFFLLLIPANQIRPNPRRTIVAGSGLGTGVSGVSS